MSTSDCAEGQNPVPADHPTGPTADPLARRQLFRGGALLAGAVAATALTTSAVTAPTASAADGDPVELGDLNLATTTTKVQIGGNDTGNSSPALALRNADGPSLQLQALSATWEEPLEVGEIANRTTGPIIGVDHGDGPANTYFALGTDIQQLPVPYATAPYRLLDTRNAAQRDNVLATSAGAFDASYRLKGGHWLDLAVFPADDVFSIQAIHANLTVAASTGSGYLTAYPPGDRPAVSALNYGKAQTVANGGFFAVDVTENHFALRIYTTATTHVIVDLTGYTLSQQPGPLADARRRSAARARRSPTARIAKTPGRGR